MSDWRLVATLKSDVSVQVSHWFQRRAIVLHDMGRERHNHTVRYGELERELDELNYEITEAIAAGNPTWEATDGSTEDAP